MLPVRRSVDRETLALRRAQTEMMLAFSRVNQQILRRTSRRLAEAGIHGITPARANALIVLFNARRPMNARELARELAVTEVTVSRFLTRMEEDGWLARSPDPSDKRSMVITTTPYARELFPRLVSVCNDVLDDLFGEFSRDELDALRDAVLRVQGNLGDMVTEEVDAQPE